MASTVVALFGSPSSNFRTAVCDIPVARASSRTLHPRAVRAIQHCTGTIGTSICAGMSHRELHTQCSKYGSSGRRRHPHRKTGTDKQAEREDRHANNHRSPTGMDAMAVSMIAWPRAAGSWVAGARSLRAIVAELNRLGPQAGRRCS